MAVIKRVVRQAERESHLRKLEGVKRISHKITGRTSRQRTARKWDSLKAGSMLQRLKNKEAGGQGEE